MTPGSSVNNEYVLLGIQEKRPYGRFSSFLTALLGEHRQENRPLVYPSDNSFRSFFIARFSIRDT